MENTRKDFGTNDLSSIYLKLEEPDDHYQKDVLGDACSLPALKNSSNSLSSKDMDSKA